MPELPEVETTRRGLLPHLAGRQVTAVAVHEARLRWPVESGLENRLVGQKLETIDRRGKYLLFRFGSGTLVAHLGMSGSMRLAASNEEKRKHDHVEIFFGAYVCLRFHDPRRFGCLLWTEETAEQHPLLIRLGVEPLSDDFNATYLFQASRHRSLPVKVLIMNAAIITGVGNIYANEALFMAGIHPRRPSSSLSLEECSRLIQEIRCVLEASIQQGGSTLRDFVNGHGAPGYFQQTLKVYQREGSECPRCGHCIMSDRMGQRSSFFCGNCQH